VSDRPRDGYPGPQGASPENRQPGWIKKLWPYLLAHKKKVFIAFGVAVAGQAITSVLPLVQRAITDNAITKQTEPIGPLLVLMIVLAAISFVFQYIRRYTGGRYGIDVQNDLRNALFERLQRLDFARHDELPTGQLVSRASADLQLIQQLLNFMPLLTGNLVLLVLSMGFMLWMSPLLTLVSLLTIPALLIVSLRLRKKMYPAQWDALQRAGEVAGVVDEAVTGVRVVKGFGQEDREIAQLADTADDLYKSRVRNVRIQAKYQAILAAIPAYGQVGVLALGGYLAIQGDITLGTFLAFATYLAQLLAPVRMVANIIAVSQQTRAAADRVFEILDSNPVVTEKDGAVDLAVARGEVLVEHVDFGYLRSEPVLSDFTLRVAPGETVALVGTSGSGKSTVSMLLPRFYDVQGGGISIDGTDVRDVTLDSLRREVGVVFEDAFLFSDSVRNNIAYGRPDATDESIRRAAEVAGATRFIEALPNSFDTMVGERGLTLSGGQRQRIAIARAVLTDPRILVLDDATSSIDARTEEQIHATLREVMEHRTTILIAHRRSTLRLAERIVVMENGRAVEQGTHKELMATSVRYRTLLAGPGEDAEADAVEELVAAGGVTADLWKREDANGNGHGARAYVSVAPVLGLGMGGGGGGGMGPGATARAAAAGGGPGSGLTVSPELQAAVEALPPADDDPDVDVAAEAGTHETFLLRRFARPYRKPLLIGLGLILLDTLVTLAGPLLVQRGLQQGVLDGSEKVLFTSSLFFLFTVTADMLLTWGYTRYTGRTAERLLFALRIRIFAHLQRLALDYYDREMAGRIMTRMTTDVDAFSQLLQTGLIQAFVSLLSFFGVLIVLAVLCWQLTLAIMLILPPLVVATIWFRRASAKAYTRARDAISVVNAEFQENLSGVRVAQAYVREDRNIDSFRTTTDTYRDARVTTQRIQSFYFPLIMFLSTCADVIVFGVGNALVQNGVITTATIITFILFLDQFFAPIQQLSQVFDQWQSALASMVRINELMHTEVSTPEVEHPVEPGRVTGAIRLDDVRFAYPNTGVEIMHGVDLDIAPGETIALVGETGAGKSTIVKLVARFYDVTSGRVLIDGTPITDLDLRAFRRRLGYVPQEPFLFSGTIRDNIAYGRPEATDEEVEQASRAVGAHDFVAELPGGYLQPVTERGRSLSAGQRQLICLARAQLVDPSILLLDEATANLDLSTEARVQRAMGLVASGRTTILIAHRLPTARAADRIIVVDDGQIVEMGSHDELIEQGGRYADLWSAFSMETTAA
jgi:ATP-binding cassette subfamily B protein